VLGSRTVRSRYHLPTTINRVPSPPSRSLPVYKDSGWFHRATQLLELQVPSPNPNDCRTAPQEPVTPLHLLGEESQWIDCPFCHRRARTRVSKDGTPMQMCDSNFSEQLSSDYRWTERC